MHCPTARPFCDPSAVTSLDLDSPTLVQALGLGCYFHWHSLSKRFLKALPAEQFQQVQVQSEAVHHAAKCSSFILSLSFATAFIAHGAWRM